MKALAISLVAIVAANVSRCDGTVKIGPVSHTPDAKFKASCEQAGGTVEKIEGGLWSCRDVQGKIIPIQ